VNFVDRLIAWLSPAAGAARASARLRLDQLRKYEGAGKGRRFDGWAVRRGASANTELQYSLPDLRDRHRSLMQNNPWISRAKQAIVSHTIGYGITSKLKTSKTAQKRWKKWTESTDCDADGRHNWYGLQGLIWGTVVEAGECLVRRRWRRVSDGFAVPMQIQVLEPDYLDHGKTEMLDGGARIIQGVQFNAIGKREGYWLYEDHPGDVVGNGAMSKFVPARDVLHIFRMERPGQVRGVPWGHAIILTARDSDELEDAVLFHEKMANAQGAFVHDLSAETDRPKELTIPALSEAFEPGRIDYLPPGMDVKFNTPPAPRDVSPLMRSYLLRIAAAYGITYASLTGDLTRVNFSSGRMGHIDMGRNIAGWQWSVLVPQLVDPTIAWFGEALELTGTAASNLEASHGMPRREMIDPGKEISAIKEAIRNGLTSLPAALRELGEDADELLAEIAANNDLLDQLKLVLDCDPRKSTRQSAPSARARAKPSAKRAVRKSKTRAAA
jgi:lambda family phage portal protein